MFLLHPSQGFGSSLLDAAAESGQSEACNRVYKIADLVISSDPMFLSTKKHFGDLISLYGRHIFCVNLMKVVENSPRETILSEEYREAINLINQELETVQADNRIHYMQTDFKANQKM